MADLVTIVVITYKSAPYVVDTLDSVLAQTYDNKELIISDDCSPDNTFQVCQDWIDSLSERDRNKFKRIVLTQTPQNGGICVNYNHALKQAKGEWIKYIAGDDMLEPNCIEEFVKATNDCNDKIFICGMHQFSNDGHPLPNIMPKHEWFAGDVPSQERTIVREGTIIPGPSLFIHTATLRQLGGFEEKYPFIEDYPLVMKFLKNGYRVHNVEKTLIRYRVYPESVSRSDNRFAKSIFVAIDDYAIPAAKRNKMYLWWWHLTVEKNLRSHKFNRLVNYLMVALDPIYIKKRFFKNKVSLS